MKRIIVDQEIFNLFPNFKRGIIIVSDVENAPRNKRMRKLLSKMVKARAEAEWLKHEFVKAWDEAHLKFGSNPNRFPPSIKSLLKRVQKGGGIPFINSVVASFNYISLKHVIPCGGDDIDKVEGNLHLGFAKGNEIFVPLGSNRQENPEPGEVIYFDDKTLNVMCRKWNWRNGELTKITEETKKIVINIDGVGSISQSVVEEARDELAELLTRECNASLETDLLDRNKREIEIEL